MTTGKLLGAVAAVGLMSSPASAAITTFKADLQTLNPDVDPDGPGLDPTGEATLVYDDVAGTLEVRITMSGVTPGQAHAQHIHGITDPLADSVTPTIAADADGDGFIELGEGAPLYGGILVGLTDDMGNFPIADVQGNYDYSRVFDLSDMGIFNDGVEGTDLFPLSFREIVVHGAFLPEGAGANGGEADGTAGYKAFLPVAAGELSEVPIPGAALLFAGAGLMGGAYRRFTGRKRSAG